MNNNHTYKWIYNYLFKLIFNIVATGLILSNHVAVAIDIY